MFATAYTKKMSLTVGDQKNEQTNTQTYWYSSSFFNQNHVVPTNKANAIKKMLFSWSKESTINVMAEHTR